MRNLLPALGITALLAGCTTEHRAPDGERFDQVQAVPVAVSDTASVYDLILAGDSSYIGLKQNKMLGVLIKVNEIDANRDLRARYGTLGWDTRIAPYDTLQVPLRNE